MKPQNQKCVNKIKNQYNEKDQTRETKSKMTDTQRKNESPILQAKK